MNMRKGARETLPTRGCTIVAGLSLVVLVACTATPPKNYRVKHDKLLGKKAGVLLLVDASIQRDAIGTDSDYFVISEARKGAVAALKRLRKYVHEVGIAIRGELVTVGAAQLTPDGAMIKVADHLGGTVRYARQPLSVPRVAKHDPAFADALCVLSTYASERAAVKQATAPGAQQVDALTFKKAAQIIQRRTGASSVLFLGLLGRTRSTGKAVGQFLSGLAVGIGTAFATAGLGTGYYAWFIPGHSRHSIVMQGALVDLNSGRLEWSKAVHTRGDPIHPEAMANREALHLLFKDVMFKRETVPTTATSKGKRGR